MRNINVQRYSENVKCATADGLREMLLADLAPWAATVGVQRNRVVVATYIRPNVTAGGIIRPDSTQDEDRYQGKAGLVLRLGPVAFDYEELHTTADRIAEDWSGKKPLTRKQAIAKARKALDLPGVGDWVVFRAYESYEIGVVIDAATTVSVKIVNDDAIISKIADPSTVW